MMNTPAIKTMIKLMESLPEPAQNQVVDHVRDYLADLAAETEWAELYAQTEEALASAAQQARREWREGEAKPMAYDQL